MRNDKLFPTMRDWAELLHAVAWPIVVLIALFCFRKSIDDAVKEILNRIPWEQLASLKAIGLGEMKIAQTAKQTKIPVASPPSRGKPTGADTQTKAGS
jgi:hypothetical protein